MLHRFLGFAGRGYDRGMGIGGSGATVLERLRIFVASPGDVSIERDHVAAVAAELNRGTAAEAGFVLEVVRWETHARPDMGRPQQLILDQIGEAELFVGIMWRRFGTPTGVAGSGTVEEFEHALRGWRERGQPRMLCYFSRAESEPPATVDEAKQLLEVTKFRERIAGQGLAWRYRSGSEFKDLLREHLRQILVKEFAGRRPPLDRNLLALLDLEKARCRERGVAFATPNLLVSILGSRRGAARRLADRACPGMIDGIVANLRAYEPRDEAGEVTPFGDFDWYERGDVQAARRRARAEGRGSIDARHLLLGFLDTPSGTRSGLRDALGDEGFERLVRTAENGDRPVATPGIETFFGASRPPTADDT
jgi:hypothetical protein